MILSFHHIHELAQGLEGGHSEMRDANPPENAARREVKHASNEKALAQREREDKPRAPPVG
jgi:hypothetical protein